MHQKNKIRTCLRNGYSLSLLSMDCGIKNIVNNLQEMGYIVRILYASNGKFDKIKRFSLKKGIAFVKQRLKIKK